VQRGALHSSVPRLRLALLLDVHRPLEADIAFALGAMLVGVNHRDQQDFHVDRGASRADRADVPSVDRSVSPEAASKRPPTAALDPRVDAVLIASS